MNLADPDLELIDPTPNVHSLFLHFDSLFFWAKLASRAVVRWSKRMYSCAGICSYDRGGLCDIALSEPLLKLRPRKDLIETLLHEMIHAYLFITCRDRDRDGHGPNFKAHMNRINQAAGLNISIYHDFHEEVKLYQTHWWRCDGPCQTRKPHFGIVRRSMNRPPGPSDYWWDNHKRHCGGTFVKIKEPEKTQTQKKRATPQPTNPTGDITKYINVANNKKTNDKIQKPILKESNNVPKSNVITKSNGSSTIVVSKKNNIVFNPQVKKPVAFNGTGQTVSGRSRTNSASVVDTVRNVWANKQLTPTLTLSVLNKEKVQNVNSIKPANTNKHKAEDNNISPPAKIKKIDDYFKSTATSVLKDLYGQDFVIKEVNSNKRLSVTPVQTDLVDCPVCSCKISSTDINKHLDECLNKEVIENICKNNANTNPGIHIKTDTDTVKNISNDISAVKVKNEMSNNQIKTENTPLRFTDIKAEVDDEIDLTYNKIDVNANIFDKNTNSEDIKSFQAPKVDDDLANVETSPDTRIPIIKIEPGCSKDAKGHKCPCCGDVITKPIDQHFDECLAFFDNNTTIPVEGASTSFAGETIVIDDDDDDEFDETLKLNATGTKSPCPCCLKMIEFADMNEHLDACLS